MVGGIGLLTWTFICNVTIWFLMSSSGVVWNEDDGFNE